MSEWIPSLNALRAFECVARHLSYQAAAQELRVTPAAVKQLVSKLEASLETRLVTRKGRGLALTATGKAAQHDLASAMQHIGIAVSRMRAPKSQHRLIITVESSFATAWLVPRLEQFRALYPQFNVLVDSSQHIVDLPHSDVDVAIRYGVDRGAGLITHRLFEDHIFPACSQALASGPPALTSLDDLHKVPLIHWDMSQLDWARKTRNWFAWRNWLAKVGANNVDTDRGLHFSDYGQAVQAAIAGQGMILASWPILSSTIDAGLLVRPFEHMVTTDIGYDLVTTKQAHTRPEVKAFVAWIREIAGNQPSLSHTLE